MRDDRLIGSWRLDSGVRQPEYLEEIEAEFLADGTLVYRYLHDGEPSSVSLSYDADGSVLTTRGSVTGKEGRIRYHFTPDGSLVYADGAHYRRVEVERPIQPPQHNAGSRPSSGDSPASQTPSAPAPRG